MPDHHIPTVLCIEDNASLLTVRKAFLESQGYRVWATSDVQKALAIVEHERVDAVVLDYRMAPMDGEASALAIRAVAPTIPILLCSGFPSQIPEHLLLLVDGFVPKGVPAEFFLSAIEGTVGGEAPKKPVRGIGRKALAKPQRMLHANARAVRDNVFSIEDYGQTGRRRRR